MSQKFGGEDAAMIVISGLLGALPSESMGLPPQLERILGGIASRRSQFIERLGDGNTQIPIQSILEFVAQTQPELAWLTELVDPRQVQQNLAFDLDIDHETLHTGRLLDLWGARRGWQQGSQPYHEAKALAYSINACVGMLLKPNPLSFVLATWHGYKALMASRTLTAQLEQLVSMAIAESDVTMKDYDVEVAFTEQNRIKLPVALKRGETDDIDDLFPTNKRRY
jgi:hypothetical protein